MIALGDVPEHDRFHPDQFCVYAVGSVDELPYKAHLISESVGDCARNQSLIKYSLSHRPPHSITNSCITKLSLNEFQMLPKLSNA